MDNFDSEKYYNDKKGFFRAATASGILMFLFYAIPYGVHFLLRLFSVDIGQTFEDLNFSFEVKLFLDGVYQLADLLLAVFIVTRFYKFKPFSVFKKYGLADENEKREYEYGNNYTLIDDIDHQKAKNSSRLTWDKILLIGIPVMYAFNIAASYLALGITKIVNICGFKVPEANLDLTSNAPLNVILFLVRLCILAPFIEEFLMRGCMLKILKPYGNWFAIIVTAIMFGLLHDNIGQGIGAVAIGILFGVIAIKSESIYPTMVLHGVNNLFSSLATILGGKFGNEKIFNGYASFLGTIILGGAVMFFMFVKKVNLKNDNKSSLKTGECARRYILNPAVLCYVAANLFIFVLLFFVEN